MASAIQLYHVKARTVLLHTGQVPVSRHLGIRKEAAELPQQFHHPLLLRRGTGIRRTARGIQSALITDADAATIEATGVCSHLQQAAVLRQGAVLSDIEMITYGTEAPFPMVTEHLFRRIVLVTSGGRAVDDEEADRVRSVHHPSAFHPGQQGALVGHFLPADPKRKTYLYHRSRSSRFTDTRRYAQGRQGSHDGLHYCLQDFHPAETFG